MYVTDNREVRKHASHKDNPVYVASFHYAKNFLFHIAYYDSEFKISPFSGPQEFLQSNQ